MGAGTSFRRSPFSSTRPDSGIQARLHVTLSGLQRRRKVAFWVDLTLDPPASERLESDLQPPLVAIDEQGKSCPHIAHRTFAPTASDGGRVQPGSATTAVRIAAKRAIGAELVASTPDFCKHPVKAAGRTRGSSSLKHLTGRVAG